MSIRAVYTKHLPRLMAKSRTKRPLLRAFGGALRLLHAQFEEKRGGRHFSHKAIALMVGGEARPHLSLDGSTLHRWEDGQTENPDFLVLQDLARVYGADVQVLLQILDANRRDPLLLEADGEAMLRRGGGDASTTSPAETSPRIQDPGGLSATDTLELAVTMLDVGLQLQRTAEQLIGRQVAVVGDPSAHHAKRARKRH